jgi:phosphoglycolate phosphatase
MSDYKTAIFDLDGTLVDSLPGIEYALTESIKLIMPETVVQLPDLRPYIGPPLPELIKLLFPDLLADTMEKLAVQFRLIYDDTGWQKTRVYEHVIDTLSWLTERGISCFLVTNKRFRPVKQILARFGLLPFFKEVVTADMDHTNIQSKETMVRYLVEKHRLNPGKTLVVGDTIDDGGAAQMCGMNFAVAAYGYGDVHQFNNIRLVRFLNGLDDVCNVFKGGQANEKGFV